MRKLSKLVALIAAVTLLAACGGPKPSTSSPETTPVAAASDANVAAEAQAKEKQALEAGVEAVVYGLPLVIMDITRLKTSNVARPESFAAPVNQFVNVREFPDASFRDVVRANVDTLYSSAWLDLSKEPIVLSVPDTKGRYYLMPMIDAWTNIFASPGKRTTGTKPGHFAISGPGWSGALPGGVTELKSPTNMVWIIGRTQTNGPQDYAAVHAIQDPGATVDVADVGAIRAGRIDVGVVGAIARVPLQALRGDKTLAELAQQHDIHPNQITSWKSQLLEHAPELFDNGHSGSADSERRLQELHAKIGELTMERDFLANALGRFPAASAKR